MFENFDVSLSSALLAKHTAEDTLILRQLSISLGGCGYMSITIIGHETAEYQTRIKEHSRLEEMEGSHSFYITIYDTAGNPSLAEYLRRLPLLNLQTLCLASYSVVGAITLNDLHNMLALSPAVTSLHIRTDSFHFLPHLLRPRSPIENFDSGNDCQGGKIVPLPLLEYVDIGYMQNLQLDSKTQSNPYRRKFRRSCIYLGKILRARAYVGAPPLSVQFRAIRGCDDAILDLLSNAFTAGIGILERPKWVEVSGEDTLPYEEFARNGEYRERIAKSGERRQVYG